MCIKIFSFFHLHQVITGQTFCRSWGRHFESTPRCFEGGQQKQSVSKEDLSIHIRPQVHHEVTCWKFRSQRSGKTLSFFSFENRFIMNPFYPQFMLQKSLFWTIWTMIQNSKFVKLNHDEPVT